MLVDCIIDLSDIAQLVARWTSILNGVGFRPTLDTVMPKKKYNNNSGSLSEIIGIKCLYGSTIIRSKTGIETVLSSIESVNNVRHIAYMQQCSFKSNDKCIHKKRHCNK